MEEALFDIPGHPRYKITMSGFIWDTQKHAWKSTYITHKKTTNYLSVCIDGKSYLVHRLVASIFCPKPEGKYLVMHLDNNGLNNHYLNLKWGTDKENHKQSHEENRRNFEAAGLRKAQLWEERRAGIKKSVREKVLVVDMETSTPYRITYRCNNCNVVVTTYMRRKGKKLQFLCPICKHRELVTLD